MHKLIFRWKDKKNSVMYLFSLVFEKCIFHEQSNFKSRINVVEPNIKALWYVQSKYSGNWGKG